MKSNPVPSYHIPPVHSPFFEGLQAQLGWSEHERRVAVDLNRRGYAIVDFEEPEFDAVAAEIVDYLCDRLPDGSASDRFDGWQTFDGAGGLVRLGPFRHLARRLYGARAPRVTNAWKYSAAVRRIATNAGILHLLERLYGRRPFPFQTLNFKTGTEQRAHADTVHFHSVPQGYMCGVWVALENMDDDNGPLEYYPGSHLEPPIDHQIFGRRAVDYSFGRRRGSYIERHNANYAVFEDFWRDLIAARGWTRERLTCRKGTAIIWVANLLHGGAPIRDPSRTRYSQATHYYFDDCLYYKPLWSDPMLGRIRQWRAVDVSTGRRVSGRYGGRPVRLPWRDLF